MPSDVTAAINEQSLEAAAGALGQNNAEAFEYVIKYGGRFTTEAQYEDIIIKALDNGQFLRLQDVAEVELDAEGYNVISYTNGLPGVSMAVYQTPGSNAQEIIQTVHSTLDDLEENFPRGLSVFVNFDTNEFLTASIDKVVLTLIEAFILVFIVVFISLQDFRSTLIPAIAVPVSIIGTFFFLGLFGYSINLLTLFALVLAIGIVVDDAIVVVEAVHAKLEAGAKSGLAATHSAMEEITGAIISITLVMGAVFIPVTFITGPTGVFYEQFGVTLIVAIFISAINALTLSPALCALFLKPHHDEEHKKKSYLQRFYATFNTAFDVTTKKYVRSLSFLYRHKWVTAVVLVASVGGIYWAASTTPSGFVPNEDRGMIFVNVELPAIANISSVYFQLLALDEQLRITEETIENRETGLETTKALKEAGNVTEVGVKQTEAQLHTARALVVDIKVNIKLLENTLSILLGEAPQNMERSNLDQQTLGTKLKVGFPVQLLRNRPDVIAAEYNLVNAFELTNVAKSNFYPSLTISTSGGLQSLELNDLLSVNSLFASVIGGLTQPILNGRRIRTQYEVALSQQEQAYLNFRQAIINASREVSDASYSFEAAEKKIEIKSMEFEAYDLATTYSEELLNNGFVNYLEVLTARENALNSQLDLINARFNRLNSVVELYRALGGGWQ